MRKNTKNSEYFLKIKKKQDFCDFFQKTIEIGKYASQHDHSTIFDKKIAKPQQTSEKNVKKSDE